MTCKTKHANYTKQPNAQENGHTKALIELVALLSLSSCCLVMVVWLFLAVPWVCLRFVIVVIPDHIRCFCMVFCDVLLFLRNFHKHDKGVMFCVCSFEIYKQLEPKTVNIFLPIS